MGNKRFNVGTVDDLFRDDEYMSDSDDVYLNKAAENFEKKPNELNDHDDQHLLLAAENYENSLNVLNVQPKRLVFYSKKEIQEKRLHAMVRLRHAVLGKENLEFITEFFFHPLNWPTYALDILFSKDFVYATRLQLAAFFVDNGLIDPCVAEKIYKLHNPYCCFTKTWIKRFDEFRRLFDYLKQPLVRAFTYYYDIQTNQNLYLNGSKKGKTH